MESNKCKLFKVIIRFYIVITMHIEITNNVLILIGALSLILLPQIHLLLIFFIYAIIEELVIRFI